MIKKIMAALFFRARIKSKMIELKNFSGQTLHSLPSTRGAKLPGVSLVNADLTDLDFTRATLGLADLRGALLDASIFEDIKAEGICLSGASAQRTNFMASSLACSDFKGTNFRDASFAGADLSHSDFTGCDLRDVDFRGAKTFGVRFFDCRLQGALFDDLQTRLVSN